MDTSVSSLRSNTPQRLIKIIIPVLVAVAIAFNVFTLIFALRWGQSLFLGTFLYPGLTVSDAYNPDWAARRLGVETGDRILTVDNTPVSTSREIFLLLSQKEAGSTVPVDFRQAGSEAGDAAAVNTLTLPLTPFTWPDLLVFFWLPYTIGLVYLVLGVVVYRLRGAGEGGDVFVAFCIAVSILAGGIFDQNTLHFLTVIWAIALPFTGATLLHLGFVFPKQTRLTRRYFWFRYVPYGVAVMFTLANLYSFYFLSGYELYLTVRLWDFGLIGISIILFLFLQLKTRMSTLSPLVRQQTSIVFGGSLVAFAPATVWTLANLLGFHVSLVWPIFAVVFLALLVDFQ